MLLDFTPRTGNEVAFAPTSPKQNFMMCFVDHSNFPDTNWLDVSINGKS